jgi:hypothetical protein
MIVIPNRMRVVMVVSALALAAGLLTLASLATPTQAQSDTTSRVPFEQDYVNACTGGELFHISGTILTVGHHTIAANGGQHFQYVENTRGTGENLTTGAEYAYNNKRQGQVNWLDGGFTYYDSYVVTMRRQGSTTADDDLEIMIWIKQTVNANGELTTQILNFGELSCK